MPVIRKRKSVGSHPPNTSINTPITGSVSKRKVAGNQPPRTSMSTRNTPAPPPPLSPKLVPSTTSIKAKNTETCLSETIILAALHTPPTSNRYSRKILESATAIPSDTTEWDPEMVSPTKMDPAYKPSPISTVPGRDLRSGWISPQKSTTFFQKQKSTSSQGEGGFMSSPLTAIEGPIVGMSPTTPNANIDMTQFPLKFPGFCGSETDKSPGANSYEGTTFQWGSSPLGKDIPPPFHTIATSPTRRATRSSTFLQPFPPPFQIPMEEALPPVLETEESVVGGYQPLVSAETKARSIQAQKKHRKIKNIRRRHLGVAVESKEFNGALTTVAELESPAILYTAIPSTPARKPVLERLPHAIVQTPTHPGRAVGEPKIAIDNNLNHFQHTAVGSLVTTAQTTPVRKNVKINGHGSSSGPIESYRARVDQSSDHGLSSRSDPDEKPQYLERTNGKRLALVIPAPRHLGKTTANSQVAIDQAQKNLKKAIESPLVTTTPKSVPEMRYPISTMTPKRHKSLPSPVTPSQASQGLRGSNAEFCMGSPNDSDDGRLSWAFIEPGRLSVEQRLMVQELTPESEKAFMDSENTIMGEARFEGGRISGATPTSYSQCPGSPSSLICMYRVHCDFTAEKRKGLSQLHTKRTYIGERALLDLDMQPWGTADCMEIEEVDKLIDEMIGGELGCELKLASVERDKETKGQCLASMKYAQLI